MEATVFYPGEIIFEEGRSDERLFILKSGEVMLYTTIDSDEKKEDIPINHIVERGVFGEVGFIDGKERMFTAKAIKQSEIIIISKGRAKKPLSELPPWANVLFKVLLYRTRNNNLKLKALFEKYEKVHSLVEFYLGVRSSELSEIQQSLVDTAKKGQLKTKSVMQTIALKNEEIEGLINDLDAIGL